jgi:hypothetical protein
MTRIRYLRGAGISVFTSGHGVHTIYYTTGTESYFPAVKQPECDVTTHLHLASRLRMRGAISPVPHTSPRHCA